MFGIAGFLATAGWVVGLCGEEAWALLRIATTSVDLSRWPWYARDEIVLPELRQFIDERRAPD